MRLFRRIVGTGLLVALGGCSTGERASAQPPDFTSMLKARTIRDVAAPHSAEANAAMLSVDAASYAMGRADGRSAERPAHEVALEAFRIDRTEVTNAAFAEFLNALMIEPGVDFAAGEAPASLSEDVGRLLREGGEGSGLYSIIALDDDQARIGVSGGRFVVSEGYADHPVTESTWAGARAYCRWRGGRLPSEAQWEAAARGEDGRLYPWGDAPPDEELVFVSGRTGVTAPVGSRPAGASPVGALDMSGSLAEWTSSLRRAYPYDAEDGREDPRAAGERVTRGGDYIFDTGADALTATHRTGFSNEPSRGHRHIGFRCAAEA